MPLKCQWSRTSELVGVRFATQVEAPKSPECPRVGKSFLIAGSLNFHQADALPQVSARVWGFDPGRIVGGDRQSDMGLGLD